MSGLQCPVALWSGLRLENDPQSSTDTIVLEDVRENQPAVLMWRSANTLTSGTVNSPADSSDKPNRHSLAGTRLCERI